MTFGERLASYRKAQGLSLQAMANEIGISAPGYKRLEDGTGAKTFEKLPKIAKALGRRIDDLFPEMDEPGAASGEGEAPETAPETAPEKESDDWPDGWRD